MAGAEKNPILIGVVAAVAVVILGWAVWANFLRGKPTTESPSIPQGMPKSGMLPPGQTFKGGGAPGK